MFSHESSLDTAKMLQALTHSIALLAPCGGDSAKIKAVLIKNRADVPTESSQRIIFEEDAEFSQGNALQSVSSPRASPPSSLSSTSNSKPSETKKAGTVTKPTALTEVILTIAAQVKA